MSRGGNVCTPHIHHGVRSLLDLDEIYYCCGIRHQRYPNQGDSCWEELLGTCPAHHNHIVAQWEDWGGDQRTWLHIQVIAIINIQCSKLNRAV